MQKMCLSTGWLLGTVMASGPWMSTKVAGKWGGGGRLCLSAWQPDLRTQHGQLVALSVRLPSVSSEFHCMSQDLHWQGLCQVLDGAAGCGKCSACWCVTAGVPRSPPQLPPPPPCAFLTQVFPAPPISRGTEALFQLLGCRGLGSCSPLLGKYNYRCQGVLQLCCQSQ